jgi:hypothetical protein
LYVNGNAYINTWLNVNGSNNFTLGLGGANVRSYDITSGTQSDLGAGPLTFSLSCYFAGNIKANVIYSSSDRRLKTDIKDFDMPIDKYKELRPKSYKWKNNLNHTCIGLIAQDVLSIASEMINISENKSMTVEDPNVDIENAVYSLDYAQLSVINCSIIKKLLKMVESQAARIEKLENKNN